MSYSYSCKSSSGGSDMPRSGLSNDAEFQAAKMQAMMGAPLGGGSGGNNSYSYKSSSNTGGTSVPITTITHGPSSALGMDVEMARMKREMEGSLKPNLGDSTGGSSSYSYSSKSSSGATSPRSIHVHQEPLTKTGGGTTVNKVVTTTTTKTNPQATRELESLERDFNRIGRTPDNYQDDFDKLKREIATGEAYRGDTNTHEPVSIRVREEHLRGMPSHVGSPLSGSGHTKTTTTTRSFGSGAPMTEETVVKTSSGGLRSQPEIRPHHHSGEIFIPVKTYDNTFDDLHMNRWLDHRDNFGSITAPELDTHKMDWENKLRGMKTGMYKFSPNADFGNSAIESSRTISKNPLGNPEFSVQFDMRDFKAEDINLTTKHGKLIINATHEDKIGNSTSRREFTRSVDLPADIQINMMRSVFSRDGVLSITAPIKPPHYDPTPELLHQTPNFTQMSIEQPFTSVPPMQFMTTPPSFDSPIGGQVHRSTAANYSMLPTTHTASPASHATPSYEPLRSPTSFTSTSNKLSTVEEPHNALDFTLPVAGYAPEEIDVTVEGRKVKVHGKHIENRVGGRKMHNEFTKMFDLPADVSPEHVRGYVKDGHTLHIVAHLSSDIQGAVHFIPITRKW